MIISVYDGMEKNLGKREKKTGYQHSLMLDYKIKIRLSELQKRLWF